MSDIDISNLNKAEVLASLYNRSHTQGMGALQAIPGEMTVEDAQSFLDAGQTYFDYLHGRVMKIDLSGDTLSLRLYDRDCGEGAGAKALAGLTA